MCVCVIIQGDSYSIRQSCTHTHTHQVYRFIYICKLSDIP